MRLPVGWGLVSGDFDAANLKRASEIRRVTNGDLQEQHDGVGRIGLRRRCSSTLSRYSRSSPRLPPVGDHVQSARVPRAGYERLRRGKIRNLRSDCECPEML
jgi:hypothetical protein